MTAVKMMPVSGNGAALAVQPPNDALLEQTTLKLLAYCRANDWSGYDPYDALNSKLWESLPFLQSKPARLLLTQGVKRSPFNLRPLLLVPRTQNPKGLALFLSSILKLVRLDLAESSVSDQLIMSLRRLRSPQSDYWCWGYSFPWQGRHVFVPRGSPNLVCTTFVSESLLDAFEQNGDEEYLEMAASAARYLVDRLFWTDGDSVASFSYPDPSARSLVHNANLLGAALLCRVHRHRRDDELLEKAMLVTRYAASRQRPDGSWPYGELDSQQWIDNFHTGFNLCALRRIGEFAKTEEFNKTLARGFVFYREHFFREDGAPKYFHDRTYPIDAHSAAQSIITLLDLAHLDASSVAMADRVYNWAIENLWDERGYFYYRKVAFGTIKTSYMRWSQAWMLLALATFLERFRKLPDALGQRRDVI